MLRARLDDAFGAHTRNATENVPLADNAAADALAGSDALSLRYMYLNNGVDETCVEKTTCQGCSMA